MKTSTLFGVLLVFGATLLGRQTGQGGGVVTNCAEASLRTALVGGGAVTFACDGTITLAATITISNNTTLDASGHQVTISGSGAVRVFLVCTNVQFAVANLTVANGWATNGGGLLNAGGIVNITNCTFSGNMATNAAAGPMGNGSSGSGGAVANQGILSLANCSLANNGAFGGAAGAQSGSSMGYAGGDGAGGAVWNSGLVLVSGCTFAGNSAVGGTGGAGGSVLPIPYPGPPPPPGGIGGNGSGGALFNCGTARLVNCTLACNSGTGGAGGQGGVTLGVPPQQGPNGPPGYGTGGIYDASGQCYLTNCTVVFNSGTGIWTTYTDGAKVINTLLAGNTGNTPGGNGCGTFTDLGHNLSSDLTCAFTNSGSRNNIYPLLGPLTNNGGPTLTVALLPGCLAIDAGDTLAAPPTDQRGIPRSYGLAADVGAYEYNQATNPSPSTVVTECAERGLLAAMTSGGHVTFACDGTILVSNTIAITTNMFVDAAGHQITLQGSGVGLFQVSSNVVFSIADLVLTGGTASAGAGIQNNGGTVNVTNCVFSGNYAPYGGALNNSGTMTVDLCTFAANSAAGANGISGTSYGASGGSGGSAAGGAIYNVGTLTMSRSLFASNMVVGGSGGNGYPGHWGEFGASGSAGGSGGWGGNGAGGALYNAGAAQVISSTFAFNSAIGGNGGAGGYGGGATAGACANGGAGGGGGTSGGALFNMGDLRILNSTFILNSGSAGRGGAGGDGGSTASTYEYGGSGGSGGNGGSVAGAVYDYPPYVCWITNCTFAMNSGIGAAAGAGGAGGGSGLQNGNPGAPGSAGSQSGGINTAGGRLVNTLLTANQPGGNGSVHIVDLGHNLSSDASCAFSAVGSMNNIDPRLGPLANNGGPTPTMALLPSSPAIDAGDDMATTGQDQRGLPRPVWGAVDIGAFEYGSPALLRSAPGATGGIDVTAIGQRGQVCWLLASPTLFDWVPVSTNQFSSSGCVMFHDNPGPARRFYRMFLP